MTKAILLCHTMLWGGATPSQINSLGSIQVWTTSTFGAVYLFLQSPLCRHHSYTHSHKADRSPVVGHILTVHTLSFMCTIHIVMTVHTPAFLWVGEHLTQTGQLVGLNWPPLGHQSNALPTELTQQLSQSKHLDMCHNINRCLDKTDSM